MKANKPDEWTDELQGKLDAINAELKPKFVPRPGEEGNVVLKVYTGDHFDHNTGKETEMMWYENLTKNEFDQFYQFGASVGLKVAEVIYDPYGKAKDLVK